MDERRINPDDAAFLISRSLDEALSPQEQQRLDTLLAQNESLRREAEQMGKVARLLRRWGVESVQLDWEHHARQIEAGLSSPKDEALNRVDRLLRRWGEDGVQIDEDAFRSAVLHRVRRTGKAAERPAWRSSIFRFGAPLAAAAALVFAVTTGFWHRSAGMAVCDVRFATPSAAATGTVMSDFDARVFVRFGRTPVETAEQGVGIANGPRPVARDAIGVSFVSVGSAGQAETQTEMPPV